MNYEMVALARQKLKSLGMPVTPERFFYDSHAWSERKVSIFQIQHEFEEFIINDSIPDDVEDYALAVLSGRFIPLEVCDESQKLEFKPNKRGIKSR